MGKRFVPVREADQRAMKFHLRLKEIEQMAGVEVTYPAERTTVVIADKNNPMRHWIELKVDGVLGLNIAAAKAQGGNYFGLFEPAKKRRETPPISHEEVATATKRFLEGEDDL